MLAGPGVYEKLDPKVKNEPGRLVFGQKTERRLWFRGRIIWLVFKLRWDIADAANEVGTTVKTVKKWCARFVEAEIAGLNDLPRSGRPPVFTVEQRCEVLAVACDQPSSYVRHNERTSPDRVGVRWC